MPIMPLLFYVSIAVGVAAVVFYLFKRRERGDDSATKLGLHS
jgi:hypothetical protein